MTVKLSDVDNRLKLLTEAVRASGRKLPVEIASVLNQVARKTKGTVNKQIRVILAAKKKTVDKGISVPIKANAKSFRAVVKLGKTKRIPLRDFAARQGARGVKYRISKQGGRKLLPSGFIVGSLGEHVFSRTGKFAVATKGRYAGLRREKIAKRKGPSPWGVFVKNKLEKPTGQEVQVELLKQMDRRIKFNVLKASGEI